MAYWYFDQINSYYSYFKDVHLWRSSLCYFYKNFRFAVCRKEFVVRRSGLEGCGERQSVDYSLFRQRRRGYSHRQICVPKQQWVSFSDICGMISTGRPLNPHPPHPLKNNKQKVRWKYLSDTRIQNYPAQNVNGLQFLLHLLITRPNITTTLI